MRDFSTFCVSPPVNDW